MDSIDRQILGLLQVDGRMTNVELAARVGLTAPPCLRRVRALEEAGAIKGYHAELDHEALGYPVTVFAMVSLTSQSQTALDEFEAYAVEIPEVRECYMLNGETDFMLKVVARDLAEFQEFVTGRLSSAPHLASFRTSLLLRTGKDAPGVPIAD